MTPPELKAMLMAEATAHFDERVPSADLVGGPLQRELVIYLMAGFACAALIKYVEGDPLNVH
jgi:hypothetical protein